MKPMSVNGSFRCKRIRSLQSIVPKLYANGEPSANPLVECVHCIGRFRGGVNRIRGHLLGLSSRGARKCLQVLQDAKNFFQATER
jgi:hypothetical protein